MASGALSELDDHVAWLYHWHQGQSGMRIAAFRVDMGNPSLKNTKMNVEKERRRDG